MCDLKKILIVFGHCQIQNFIFVTTKIKCHELCLKLHHAIDNHVIDKKKEMNCLIELQLWRIVTWIDVVRE